MVPNMSVDDRRAQTENEASTTENAGNVKDVTQCCRSFLGWGQICGSTAMFGATSLILRPKYH